MPTVYSCSSCDFKVSLGWFHYHVFDSGYCAETQLMCKDCGTEHLIRIALSHKMQEEMQKKANIIIDDIGTQPYEVRRILREATNYNRPEADKVLASMPGIFMSNVSYPLAQTILERLERLNVIGHLDVTHDVEYRKDLLFALTPQVSDELQSCRILGEYDTENGRFNLEEQECAFCHAKGTLISELPNSANNLCPNCKKLSLSEISVWRT